MEDLHGQFTAPVEASTDSAGKIHEGNDWGTVITRGGYLVHSWGDPDYTYQTASVGKTSIRATLGLAVKEGLIHEDDPLCGFLVERERWTPHTVCPHRGPNPPRTITSKKLLFIFK